MSEGQKRKLVNRSSAEGINALVPFVNLHIAATFRIVLEEKHLYQRVTIPFDRFAVEVRETVIEGYRAGYDRDLRSQSPRIVLGSTKTREEFCFAPVNVKLYCRTCKRREAYSCLSARDITSEILNQQTMQQGARFTPPLHIPPDLQIFLFVYRCEGCSARGKPEAFLLRREGWVFSIDGRSPLEHIEIPAFIPEKEKRLYRDAIIANSAGKTLAATFYLRCFVEQFARRVTGMEGRHTGEEIMSAYAKTLPVRLRDDLPSLKECYEQLSVPIHDARDDADLFKKALESIESHFDIRRALKVAEESAKKIDTKSSS